MKDFTDEEIKSVIINNVLYAKYAIDEELEVLFLKVVKDIVKDNDYVNEQTFEAIIAAIEPDKKFEGIAYLNIP